MRWIITFILSVGFLAPISAHHPDYRNHRVFPYIDVIGPLGRHLPLSYRRKYNRPSYLGGKIAYHIAPSSQEAMAWHDAAHRGAYRDHRGRLEKQFFYPKPWEVLQIGARVPKHPQELQQEYDSSYDSSSGFGYDDRAAADLVPTFAEPISDSDTMIEQ